LLSILISPGIPVSVYDVGADPVLFRFKYINEPVSAVIVFSTYTFDPVILSLALILLDVT